MDVRIKSRIKNEMQISFEKRIGKEIKTFTNISSNNDMMGGDGNYRYN